MQDSHSGSIFGLSHTAGLLLFAAGADSCYHHLLCPSDRAPDVSQAGADFRARTGILEGNPSPEALEVKEEPVDPEVSRQVFR